MDSGHDPSSTVAGAPAVVAAPTRRSGGRLKRIVVGGVVAFAGMSLLYGPTQAAMMLGLAVICTAGIGLIPILFLSWVVGWIVLEVWGAIAARRGVATVT